jgi:hypothetical protein
LEPYLGMQRERNPEYLRDMSIRRVMFLHLVVTPGEYKRLVHELSDGTVEPDTTIITFAIDLSPSTHWLVVLERRRTPLRLPKTPQKLPNPKADKRKLEADLAAALAVEDYRAAAKLQHELKSNYGANTTKVEEKPKKRR